MENNTVISIQNLVKQFPVGREFFTALKNITLDLRKGEFTGLVGPSGSGKSTLLNIAGLLERPTSGEVLVDGKPTSTLGSRKRGILRGSHIGFVFQFFNLFARGMS